ncbi:MAG: cob(I)yrinic acid a,c-diamide adenosyltransferase [Candidatus Bipolaricaulia bacterium]
MPKWQDQDELGLVSLYWGDGKGKTTAALGMALRALGHGLRVHLIQFFKGGDKKFQEYGELIALRRFSNFSYEQFGVSDWIVGQPTEEQIEVGQRALKAAGWAISSREYDLVILDEILYAIALNVLKAEDVLKLLEQKAPRTEVILTGSNKRLPEIEDVADLVTEIKKIKHPFDKGIKARKGIEY